MGQDGNIVQFKIKKHTALKKLMSTYCERAGLALQVAFYAFLDSFTVHMYQFRIFMFRKMTRHDQWRFHHQTIRFSFDGTRINESDTPKGLDMEVGNITLRSLERYLNSQFKIQAEFLATNFRTATPLRSSSSSLVEAGVEGKVISCLLFLSIF